MDETPAAIYGVYSGVEALRLVLDRLRMDDNFRIMNAIAPTELAQQSTEPTRKTIELSEQTPLSGFDRKQKQVEAGEIADVGASIDRVGDKADKATPRRVNYGGAAVGWEETKADARAPTRTTTTRLGYWQNRRTRRRRASTSANACIRGSSINGGRWRAPLLC